MHGLTRARTRAANRTSVLGSFNARPNSYVTINIIRNKNLPRNHQRARAGGLGAATRDATVAASAISDPHIASIVVITPSELDIMSPVGPSWHSVMSHIARKTSWMQPGVETHVFTDASLFNSPSDLIDVAQSADILICIGMTAPSPAQVALTSALDPTGTPSPHRAIQLLQRIPSRIALNCSPSMVIKR